MTYQSRLNDYLDVVDGYDDLLAKKRKKGKISESEYRKLGHKLTSWAIQEDRRLFAEEGGRQWT